MEISKSLQNYLDFGIYHFDGVDYIEGKNAEIVMSGDCTDEESGEEGEFDILDVQNGKFVKAIITSADLTCRALTEDEICEIQSDFESYDEEDTNETTVPINSNEILGEVLQTIDINKIRSSKVSMKDFETWNRNQRYKRVEQIRKCNAHNHSLDAYYNSLSKLDMAVLGDRYNRKFPVVDDISYTKLKRLMRQCWTNFISMDNNQQIYVSGDYHDIRFSLLLKAPLIEDEEILTIVENYNSTTYLTPLDNSLFADARKKMQAYKEIYEKIDANKEYKRSDFFKEILQLYPNVFDYICDKKYFIITPEDLLTFWHMYKKIDMYKKGRLYYFKKITPSFK